MPERLSPVSAVILDFYGVIREDIQAKWLRDNGLERSGVFAEASDLLDAGVITIREYLERYSEASGIPPDDIEAAFLATPSVPGMEDAVRQLGRLSSVRLGLLSNADSAPRRYLEQRDLIDCFDDIVISSEVGIRKPDAYIYQHALGRLGIAPYNALFFDDSHRNVAGGKAAFIRSYLFEGRPSFDTALAAHDIILDASTEL